MNSKISRYFTILKHQSYLLLYLLLFFCQNYLIGLKIHENLGIVLQYLNKYFIGNFLLQPENGVQNTAVSRPDSTKYVLYNIQYFKAFRYQRRYILSESSNQFRKKEFKKYIFTNFMTNSTYQVLQVQSVELLVYLLSL